MKLRCPGTDFPCNVNSERTYMLLIPLQFSIFFLHGPQSLDQCGYVSPKEQMLLMGYIHYGPTLLQTDSFRNNDMR
jgi:hypothetical protein